MLTEVQKFYAGKTILITGITGFVGQILLSKLLCSCPELHCIYVLIRKKSKKLIHQRLTEILDDPIFDRAKELHPDYVTKIKPISGNIEEKDLGMSRSDVEIINNEIEILFHCAANVKFTSTLREATNSNVKSVDFMLNIARKCTNIKAIVYVSTAFTPCAKTKFIEEKFYDPPLNHRSLFQLVEHMDDAILNEITPILIKPFPNTYVYSKLIAEDLCREKGSDLPMCIFRPAIITSCFKEPVSGWNNNFYGPIGIVFGHALGIIKFAPVNDTKVGSIVPADYTVNALILAAFFTSTSWENRSNEVKFHIPVINYSSCMTKFRITWGMHLNEFNKVLEKYPFYNMVTLPSLKLISNLKLYRFLIVIFHLLPAFVLDLALLVTGKTPRFRKLYQKIHESMDLLSFYATQEWAISVDNIYKIWAQLCDKDREIFYCDLNDLNIKEYFDAYVRGVRLYTAKDPDTTLKKAKEKRKRLLILNYVLIMLVIFVLLYLLTTLARFIGIFGFR